MLEIFFFNPFILSVVSYVGCVSLLFFHTRASNVLVWVGIGAI